MKIAQLLGLSLSEETITETCLFNLARRSQSGEIAIIPATKPQEAKHGADWEWWFTSQGKGVGYRVQAKRLFPSGRYESLFKKTDPYEQLEKLTAAASNDGCNALYCFYNFGSFSSAFAGAANNCRHSYRGPSFWGCTLALPEDVRLVGADDLRSLVVVQKPWHYLTCVKPHVRIPDAVVANLTDMARPRFFGTARRDYEVPVVRPKTVPFYIQRLIDLGRSRRDEPAAADRQFIDREFWVSDIAIEKEDLAGVLVIDHRPGV